MGKEQDKESGNQEQHAKKLVSLGNVAVLFIAYITYQPASGIQECTDCECQAEQLAAHARESNEKDTQKQREQRGKKCILTIVVA